MIPVLLTRVKTRDEVTLDGIYVKPKRKGDTALIWLHGLTSYFSSSQTLVKELSSLCHKRKIGYLKFNTRGHDIVVRGQGRHVLLGTLFEKFEDCVLDIRAMVGFAKKLGYKNIILAGHSTGANKAVYYLYKTKDRNVKGVLLLGAASDISGEIQRVGKKTFRKELQRAKVLYRKGPFSFFISKGFVYTAYRFLGLYTPGKAEDVFPYHNPSAHWTALESIRQPIAVVMGSRDECLDRPVEKHVELFRKNAKRTKKFSEFIIKGSGHSFIKKERGLAKVIVKWVKEERL